MGEMRTRQQLLDSFCLPKIKHLMTKAPKGPILLSWRCLLLRQSHTCDRRMIDPAGLLSDDQRQGPWGCNHGSCPGCRDLCLPRESVSTMMLLLWHAHLRPQSPVGA